MLRQDAGRCVVTTFLLALSFTTTWWGLGLLMGRVAAEGLANHPAVTLLRRHGGRYAR